MFLNWRRHFTNDRTVTVGGTTFGVIYATTLLPGGNAYLSQMPVEDLEESDAPNVRLSQIAVEDLEKFSAPNAVLSQLVIEILIPFSCNVSPPTPVPPTPTPPPRVRQWYLQRFDTKIRHEEIA